MYSKPFTLDRVVRLIIGLCILVFLFIVIERLSNVLLPFLISWLIAYLLQPIVKFFQVTLKLKRRGLAVAATLLLFFSILIGMGWLLIPMILDELIKLMNLTVIYAKEIDTNSFIPLAWQHSINNYISSMNIQKMLNNENIMSIVKNMAPKIWDILNNSFSYIMGVAVIFVMFIYLVFILLDFENISDSWFKIIPPKYRPIAGEIINDLEIGMNRYFRGQALVASIVGTLFIIGFSIIQLPLAVALGILIGILDLVPYLKVMGIIPAITLGVLHAAESNTSFNTVLISILVVFAIVQIIEDLFLVPRIMGKVTGLNPAVILLSLSIWGTLMGVSGLIIALPMTTLIISYYKRYVLKEGIDSITTDGIEQAQKGKPKS
jgi:predicted PurR-regulated permease PerM